MSWFEQKKVEKSRALPWVQVVTVGGKPIEKDDSEHVTSQLRKRLRQFEADLKEEQADAEIDQQPQVTAAPSKPVPLSAAELPQHSFNLGFPVRGEHHSSQRPAIDDSLSPARPAIFDVDDFREETLGQQAFSTPEPKQIKDEYVYRLDTGKIAPPITAIAYTLDAPSIEPPTLETPDAQDSFDTPAIDAPDAQNSFDTPAESLIEHELSRYFDPLHSQKIEDFFEGDAPLAGLKEDEPIDTEALEAVAFDDHKSVELERASITPKLKLNRQFQIPFNILHTQKKSFEISDPRETQAIITKLEETLEQFGIEGRVVGIQKGPIITRYELKMAPGIKVSRILSLTDELAMALEALRVRIEAPIPGRSTVGIEIPNKVRAKVLLGDIVNDPSFQDYGGELPLPLGKDIAGNLVLEDLTRLPHLLIAGATGSGKSVAVNSFITSFILTKRPDEVRFLLVDPKLVELSHYNDIPHLLHPVITDHQKAILALNWAVEEMERRYEDLADMRVRDIRSYNLKLKTMQQKQKINNEDHPPMPYIVILIDELGDLMMVAGKEVESSIIRLAQKARAVGIHLILATQRPSVDVITALIKANCPARIALQVAQKTDSRTILDSNGAEQLVGQGDLLFKHPNRGQLIRVQAPLVLDDEVENVVEQAKKQGKAEYIILEDPKANSGQLEPEEEVMFDEAWQIIVESGKASASYLQRRLRIGYNRAARLIEAFEARGMVGPQIGSKPREIFGQ